jgi:putative flippase GtrA
MEDEVLEKTQRLVGLADNGLAGQFTRYFGVAMVGLVADFGTLVFLHDALHMYYLLAAAGGFTCGLLVNYALSSRYVFRNSKLSSRTVEFLLFGAVGLVGLGILSVSMWALVSLLGVQYLLAKCLATVVVYIWNFLGRKAMYKG